MAHDEAYRQAEKKIEEALRSGVTKLDLSNYVKEKLKLTELPESLGQLTQLRSLWILGNQLNKLPESICNLKELKELNLCANNLISLPEWISELPKLETLLLGDSNGGNQFQEFPAQLRLLIQLRELWIGMCNLSLVPNWICELTELDTLYLHNNNLTDLPASLGDLNKLKTLYLVDNPLNPELAEANKQGLYAVKAYLRAKAASQITLNEAKLILVGEGEVGKSCLLGALRGDPFVEGLPTTHGIEIKPFKVTDSDIGTEITLNGWDFGGQRVYRPTHQLFFSAPAVYLVVWKPREGPQQGFVKEWIQLIKRREPSAKIIVVATHGGPQQRQPDIDRQELWDLFGKDMVIDFFHVENKPDRKGNHRGITELKKTIAHIAFGLPEVGRSVPKNWQDARETLEKTEQAFLPVNDVIEICHRHKMDDEQAHLFVTIEHRLGHLIHYQHDPILKDIVVLKPDWLATAISFVLDDGEIRKNHGLVHFSRLGKLWNDPERSEANRYPSVLHRIFVRLMERFDLCYRVAEIFSNDDADPGYLIAQLVPDTRPEKDLEREWTASPATGDLQQIQICRIVDAQNGQSAAAEGLFYQLIVRLHKYSLGREDYYKSVHWQRGLVLDSAYNGRALLEHKGNDVHITVRAPYPERFLTMLTEEVKYLVESFWEGLRCEVMVPCVSPCGRDKPGTGLFEVQKLIESKRKKRPEYPCPVCNEWQNIDCLLRNAPAARPMPIELLLTEFGEVKSELSRIRPLLRQHQVAVMGRFDLVDVSTQRIISRVDDAFTGLIQALTDEAKEGPRLFSLVPVNRRAFNPRRWTAEKFRLTLWCEHSRLPLPALNGKDSKQGIYELELKREWVKKAAPFLKVLTGTLSLVLPVASSAVKLALDDTAYKAIEEELDFSKDCIDATLGGSEKIGEWLGGSTGSIDLEHGEMIRAQGAMLRELHALLKAKDPGFGGLVRVMNKRQEFLWVHRQFEKEY